MHRLYCFKKTTDMKKHIIPIVSLLAIALFSCGGNQTQNQNQENTTPVDTATVETTAEQSATMVDKVYEINENVAEELFRKLYPEYKDAYFRDSVFASCGDEPEDCEGCYSGEELACYPLKDGGYLVAFTHVFGGPGCSGEYDYWTQIYKDGVLTDVKDVLPIPELDDLLNPSKTENYKNDIAEFRAMFEKSPMGYIYYEFQPPMSLSVRLYPWDCEEAYYNMDKVMLSPYNDDKVPEYSWDGERFVKQ